MNRGNKKQQMFYLFFFCKLIVYY